MTKWRIPFPKLAKEHQPIEGQRRVAFSFIDHKGSRVEMFAVVSDEAADKLFRSVVDESNVASNVRKQHRTKNAQ